MRAYLLSIARNLYLERLRKHQLHTRLSDAMPDPGPGLDKRAEDYDDLARIRVALQKLNEVDRVAFLLRVQHELSYEEIARVLQLSLSTVKVKIHRVRLKLTGVVANEEAFS
jgi:RNA polymerase sigma-70 factor, ECF subfamily